MCILSILGVGVAILPSKVGRFRREWEPDGGGGGCRDGAAGPSFAETRRLTGRDALDMPKRTLGDNMKPLATQPPPLSFLNIHANSTLSGNPQCMQK